MEIVQIDAIPPELHGALSIQKTPKQSPVEPAQPQKPAVLESTPAPTPTPAAADPKRKGGFFPLLLGGLVAGAIGYFAALLPNNPLNQQMNDQLTAQSSSLAEIKDQLAAVPVIDLTPIETAQAALAADLTDLKTEFETTVAGFDERISALELAPPSDGSAPVETISAYEEELNALRAQIAEMSGMAMTELNDARAEAAAIEENAQKAAKAAAGRAALARVQTAIDDGAPLGAALGDLEAALGESAPLALIAAKDGIPTLAALQESFPDVAREALVTARNAGVSGEEGSGLGAFLRTQFEVRSVTPQDGDGADAVLSRAEAAVKSGRLNDALTEISGLPDEARAVAAEWIGLAQQRADAITAIDMLSTTLNDN